VERGVEAGELRGAGKGRARRANAGEVVRLVQRRERLERRQRGEQRLVDRRRGDVRGAAVDDAVADAGDLAFAGEELAPREQRRDRFRVTGAYLPPMRPRRIITATRARSRYRGPRLPVGPPQ